MDDAQQRTAVGFTFPDFHDASTAAVRLLQGVVYESDERVWEIVLTHRSRLERHFAFIGMVLILDEPEGYAFLRPIGEDDQAPEGYENLPKLFQKSRLGYAATVLCVMLRDELRRFDDEQVDSTRCVVRKADLYEDWKAFVPENSNEGKLQRDFDSAIRTVKDLGFLKPLNPDGDDLEIRRILKARIGVQQLEDIRQMLNEHVVKHDAQNSGDSRDG